MNLRAITTAVFLAAASAFVAQASPGKSGDVLRATLPNGLRIVIVRNTLAPVVTTSVNYLVGSDEAPKGFPGTAHAQEHMMFRGSPDLSADQLADIGSLMGGQFNANTRENLTQYWFTVPAQDADIALHVEADWMKGVSDSDAEWAKERGAIEQEVANDISSPFYVLYERLRAQLFAGTPYDHDALGTRPSFDQTTAKMLRQFHDAWYTPNNAILVVVGDVDPKATLQTIKTLFAPIPRKALPPRPEFHPQPVEPASWTIPTDYPYTAEVLSFRTPGYDNPDYPAIKILADVLASQRSALYGLVPAGKAITAGFDLTLLPKGGLAYAVVSIPANGDAKAMAATMRAILLDAKKNGVSPDLVAAAKLQEAREWEFEKNSISGLASLWADAITVYGAPSPDAVLARLQKVTVADVNRAAQKYLDLDRAIEATMTPQNSGKPVATAGFGGQESITLPPEKPTALPVWANGLLGRLSVPPSTLSPVVTKLPNGLTLIVQPENVSDTVSVYGHIRNRPAMEEPAGQEGVALMLDELFSFGTQHLDRLAYQSALDEIGADEDAGADFHVQALARHFDRAVELLADNELNPALPADALEAVRARVEPYVAARNSTPSFLSGQALLQALYPANDPALRKATPESIHAITLANVESYFHTVFRPDLATIVVIGKVDPERAKTVIAKYFGGWTATGPAPQTDLPPAPQNGASAVAVPDASRVQDVVYLAQNLALARRDQDYYALALGNTLLGGGFYSSPLSVDLRKNGGLVYSVGSQLQAGRTRSFYLVNYACDPQNVSKAAAIVARDIRNMQTAPPSAEAFDRAKMELLQQIILGEASVERIARNFLNHQDQDLPIDETEIAAKAYIALTPADVQSAFAKWMRPADLARVSQGPAPQ